MAANSQNALQTEQKETTNTHKQLATYANKQMCFKEQG